MSTITTASLLFSGERAIWRDGRFLTEADIKTCDDFGIPEWAR